MTLPLSKLKRPLRTCECPDRDPRRWGRCRTCGRALPWVEVNELPHQEVWWPYEDDDAPAIAVHET